MKKEPFLYFSDEVIAKLYLRWKDCYTLKQFEDNCRNSNWQLDYTIMSYNPIVFNTKFSSWFGDPINLNKEYLIENYILVGSNKERIACMIYWLQMDCVAVSFYDF
jgi:hypothetical protein